MNDIPTGIQRRCGVCEEMFTVDQLHKTYCSKECRDKSDSAYVSVKPRPTNKDDQLTKMCAMAKELGITYGKLKALEYAKTVKVEVEK